MSRSNLLKVLETTKLSSLEAAELLDKRDPLARFRNEFHIPKGFNNINSDASGSEISYLCGNSLGLQPKITEKYIKEELKVWKQQAVEGHFEHEFNRPWISYEDHCLQVMARLAGAASPSEVQIANSLTTNLHLMMIPFYRPTKQKFKILIEAKAFPSDMYAMKSQLQYHGHNPDEGLIQLNFNDGRIKTETILEILETQGDSIALVMLPGVQYYSGQVFDMASITNKAHQKGCMVGFDLAHAIGNIPLQLHDWNVDFAVWCSYKYLNGGPGAVGGFFIHDKHGSDLNLQRFAGWWGHDRSSRFQMENEFLPIKGAKGFLHSNVNVVSTACVLASLTIFEKCNDNLRRQKSLDLVNYLRKLIQSNFSSEEIAIITPMEEEQTGSQTSLLFKRGDINHIAEQLKANGVIIDKRNPNVIRVSPVPLYNTFKDVWKFVHLLKIIMKQSGKDKKQSNL